MTSAQVDAQIRSITNQLVTKYQAEKVILFGSAAKGKMRQGSDLDFLVIKRDDRSFHQRLVDLYRLIEKDMAAAGKKLTLHRYEANHGFANPSNPSFNKEATDDAHKKTIEFLKARL